MVYTHVIQVGYDRESDITNVHYKEMKGNLPQYKYVQFDCINVLILGFFLFKYSSATEFPTSISHGSMKAAQNY
jgi:hypothetical protein